MPQICDTAERKWGRGEREEKEGKSHEFMEEQEKTE